MVDFENVAFNKLLTVWHNIIQAKNKGQIGIKSQQQNSKPRTKTGTQTLWLVIHDSR